MESSNSNNTLLQCNYTSDKEDYNNEHRVDEVFLMYGVQSTNANAEDDRSIASEGSETLNERLNSQLFVVRASASGKIVSQFPIEESDSIAAHLVERNTTSRVSCMSFRSMLQPIPKEKVPARDEVWLRRCMRGILVSAISADAQDDSLSRFQAARRSLGPEHVYCWFIENHGITPNDEDIWSFYYGVRGLAAKQDTEACLHYQLLDENNFDYAEFFVYTLLLIQSLMDQSWHAQFDMERGCQQNIWIPLDLTKQVISHMFSIWTDPPLSVEDLNRTAEGLALATPTRFESEEEQETEHASSRVDLFAFLQLLMNAHAGQINKHTTLLRVMFKTVSKDEDVCVDSERLVTMTQLHEILKTVHVSITLTETTLLYRDAYALLVAKATNGYAPRGITFDSFLFAAKRRGLFTRIREISWQAK